MVSMGSESVLWRLTYVVTYLAPGGRPGDLLKGTAVCDKSTPFPSASLVPYKTDRDAVGKTLAYTTVTFTNSKGQIAARGSHTKYVTLSWRLPPRPYAYLTAADT